MNGWMIWQQCAELTKCKENLEARQLVRHKAGVVRMEVKANMTKPLY